ASAFGQVDAEQTQLHVVGRFVLRVGLEAGALEPLSIVCFAVGERNLRSALRDGVAVHVDAVLVAAGVAPDLQEATCHRDIAGAEVAALSLSGSGSCASYGEAR